MQDEVFQDDQPRIDLSHNGSYAVGHVFLDNGRFLLESRIPIATFYRYHCQQFIDFFQDFSHVVPNWSGLEIIRFQFDRIPGSDYFYYSCVLKTFYIRLIQRRWRKVLQKRKKISLRLIYKRQMGLIRTLRTNGIYRLLTTEN